MYLKLQLQLLTTMPKFNLSTK